MANTNPILAQKIKAYRAGETLPLRLDRSDIIRFAREIGQSDTPQIGKDTYANRVLVEGREDAGANKFDQNNPILRARYQNLVESNTMDDDVARYSTAVVEKQAVAKRLGISFDEAWNGTGISNVGYTGKDYANRVTQFAQVTNKDPRNTEFMDLISRSMKGQNTPQEILSATGSYDLLRGIFNLAPTAPISYDSYEGYSKFTPQLMDNARNKIDAAVAALNSTPAGQKALSKVDVPEPTDVLNRISDTYKRYAGIETESSSIGSLDDNPIIQIMLGKDPGGRKFLARAEKDYPDLAQPDEPSIVDKIINFFSQ